MKGTLFICRTRTEHTSAIQKRGVRRARPTRGPTRSTPTMCWRMRAPSPVVNACVRVSPVWLVSGVRLRLETPTPRLALVTWRQNGARACLSQPHSCYPSASHVFWFQQTSNMCPCRRAGFGIVRAGSWGGSVQYAGHLQNTVNIQSTYSQHTVNIQSTYSQHDQFIAVSLRENSTSARAGLIIN